MDEHRSSSRRRAFKGAQIAFNDGASAIDCILRDLSDTGARLKVESPLGVPDAFALRIAGEDAQRPCRVVWRRATEIGVAFVK